MTLVPVGGWATEETQGEASGLQQVAQRYFSANPDADTNRDGVLSTDELDRHLSGAQKAAALKELGDRVSFIGDVEFATVEDQPLKLDLYLPTRRNPAGKPPLIVWIHGGGWRGGTKDRCLVIWLASEGYAVASVEYRLTGSAIFPAQVHDCKGAIRWLRAHEHDFGYDASRVAVAGGSAGGHLAALIGTSDGVQELEGKTAGHTGQSSRVQAVVNFYGPTDFLVMLERSRPELLQHLFGKPWPQSKLLAALASPATHIGSGDPPMLLIHGDRDAIVTLDQSVRFHDLYRSAGLVSHLEIVAGGRHGGPQYWDESRKAVIRQFLQEHVGRTPGCPTPTKTQQPQ